MRVALVTTSFPRSPGDASGHFVQTEAEELARAGHQVTVLAPGCAASSSPDFSVRALSDRDAFGWPGAIARLRARPWRALGASEFTLRAARELAESGPYDRIIAHFLLPSAWPIVTLALPRSSHAALEVVGHGSDVRLLAKLPGALRRHVVRELLERGARFRFVSSALRDQLVQSTLPELAAHSRVEPSPIDVAGVPARALARSQLGLGTSSRLAVIVARLIPGKNVALALAAIARLPELEAVVVGDGPLRHQLGEHFPKARFLGRLARPDALRWIAAADVLVSASREEGAPTAVREARLLGVPVVSVTAGDLASWATSDPGIWLSDL